MQSEQFSIRSIEDDLFLLLSDYYVLWSNFLGNSSNSINNVRLQNKKKGNIDHDNFRNKDSYQELFKK